MVGSRPPRAERKCTRHVCAGLSEAHLPEPPPPPAGGPAHGAARAPRAAPQPRRSATGARRPLAQPAFSGQAASARQQPRRRCPGRDSAERSEGSLDRRSPPRRYTFIPPGRTGVCAAWAPPGGQRERRRRAQHTEAARCSRLEVSTATALGGRGAGSGDRAPRAARGRRRRSLQREHGDPPSAQRGSGATRQGCGGAEPPLSGAMPGSPAEAERQPGAPQPGTAASEPHGAALTRSRPRRRQAYLQTTSAWKAERWHKHSTRPR
jgi:hypothetical protein